MDIKLRQIASNPAGTYFVVTDNSGVTEIEQTSNLRLFFINVEASPVNTIVVFKKGDKAGFQSIFGKALRKNEKQGNFSIRECLNALTSSGIAVINLRIFDNTLDKAGVFGMSPNQTTQESLLKEYTKLFNTNGLWTIKPKNIPGLLVNDNLLNFGNVGNSDISFFVTVAKNSNVDILTSEGDKTLAATLLEIEDFPALNPNSLLRDTFVDIWIFNNTFNPNTVTTNRYYGQLFNQTGMIDYSDIETLSAIAESGFNRRITGSLIPNLKNEFDEIISIDQLVNNVFAETNLVSYINDDLLELTDIDDMPVINTKAVDYYDIASGELNALGIMMSHRLQDLSNAIKSINLEALTVNTDLANFTNFDILTYTGSIFPTIGEYNKVFSIYENGIRVGDRILTTNADELITVIGIEIIDAACQDGLTNPDPDQFYTKVILTLSGPISGNSYTRLNDLLRKGKVIPTNLESYKLRTAQFTDGTASRQREILDMMLSPGIVKGLKNFTGIRYIVDSFKSFVEGNYKYQYGQLVKTLDNSNKFVRSIINEPFIEDLEKSLNPLFKQSPSDIFDFSFVGVGGNPNYSTNFLTKFTTGAEMCFYFPSKLESDGNEYPTASDVSNLFVQKTFPYDVVANASGYLDNVTGLALNPDDDERKIMEAFRWNPIIKLPKGFTIYGNSTGQKTKTALAQIHNSELLAYIKESLYNMSKDEAFKKGTYSEYLSTETATQSFMDNLALAGAIQANPIVICNASNNTAEISKQKIKLIHVEYTNIDALDKIVFDLNLK